MIKLEFKGANILAEMSVYEFEDIDGEIVLYQHDTNKILVMNETASFIWNVLWEASNSEHPEDALEHSANVCEVSDLEIVELLMRKYSLSMEIYDEIVNDVRGFIDVLRDENVLQFGDT